MSSHASATPRAYWDNLVFDGLLCGPTSGRLVRELLDAGITGCNWTVAEGSDDTLRALNNLNPFYWLAEQFPEHVILVESTEDILRAKRERKLGVVLGFQTANTLGANVQLIRIFHRLGVRIIGLTYNEGNAFASGCTEPSNGGLTSLGIQAVQEMNRIGVVVDLSHVGERSSLDAIRVSDKPVIFSHSNPSALQPNPRNISDEQIRACASKGGVIGLSVFSAFVGDTFQGRRPTLAEYLQQMDYVIELVGSDHVAVGTDIFSDPSDGVWWRAVTGRLYREVAQGMTYETHNIDGFERAADFPHVVQAMLDHGYDDTLIGKIVGGNWLRVFRQVWGA